MAIQGFELGAQDLQCFQTGVNRCDSAETDENQRINGFNIPNRFDAEAGM